MSEGLKTSLVNSENSRVKLAQVPVKSRVTHCAGEINFHSLSPIHWPLTGDCCE